MDDLFDDTPTGLNLVRTGQSPESKSYLFPESHLFPSPRSGPKNTDKKIDKSKSAFGRLTKKLKPNMVKHSPAQDQPPQSSVATIVLPDEQPRFVKLEDIIQDLCDRPDSALFHLFFLTYNAFTEPTHVFSCFVDKFKETTDESVKYSCISVIERWIQNYYDDFTRDEKILTMFNTFCNYIKENEHLELVIATAALQDQVAHTHLLSVSELSTKRRGPSLFNLLNAPEPAMVFDDVMNITFIDMNSLELARQISLLDGRLFALIQPWELLSSAWTRPEKKDSAPNVIAVMERCNIVYNWVISEISSHKAKHRLRIVDKFLEVIEHLRHLNNFNGLCCIVAAFESQTILRLKVFTTLTSNKHNILERAREIYKNPREALTCAVPPLVPYPGAYLTELALIDGKNKSISDGTVNLHKLQLFHKIISQLQLYQHHPYCLAPIPAIQDWLSNLSPPITEEFPIFQAPSVQPMMTAQVGLEQPFIDETPEKDKETERGLGGERMEREREISRFPLRTIPNITVKPPPSFLKLRELPRDTKMREVINILLNEHKEQINQAYLVDKLNVINVFAELVKVVEKVKSETLNNLKERHAQALADIAAIQQEIEQTPIPSKSARHQSAQVAYEWCYVNEGGVLTPYDSVVSSAIENEFLVHNGKGLVRLTHASLGNAVGGYLFDFEKMLQITPSTGHSRAIQRNTDWISKDEHEKKIRTLEEKIKKTKTKQEKK